MAVDGDGAVHAGDPEIRPRVGILAAESARLRIADDDQPWPGPARQARRVGRRAAVVRGHQNIDISIGLVDDALQARRLEVAGTEDCFPLVLDARSLATSM